MTSRIHLRWMALFALWLLFLSGTLANILGTPGILQAVRLNNLLQTKQAHLSKLQEGLHQLQAEISDLESNKFTQQREIRKVLGYAAPDELIFDFSTR